MQTDLAGTQKRGLIARLLASDAASSSFVRFLVVGAIAYVITQLVLALFYDVLPVLPDKDSRLDLGLFKLETRLFLASAIAVESAIIFKFFANEHWAFAGRKSQMWIGARVIAFNISCLASAGVTIAAVNILTPVFDLSPYIANTIGTLLGFMVNYVMSAYFIWSHPKQSETATG